MEIDYILKGINPLYEECLIKAKLHNDNLVKPIGSLGKLEDIAIKISGITGKLHNKINKKAIIIMCADNGVYEEGVSTAPQTVTAVQTLNFFKGVTGVAVLAKQGGIDLKVVDIGIKEDLDHPMLIKKKTAYGTKNIAKEAAMSESEMFIAINTGFEIVEQLKNENYNMIGTGEMGISNTTTSEAVIISMCQCSINEAVGMGAGLTKELFEKKKAVIKKAIDINTPDKNNPLDVLMKLGGFDIAGLVGCFLGAAYYRIPIIIDGVISIAAALIAYSLNPLCKEYMFPSHLSRELGYKIAAEKMGISSYFDLGLRLGEGSGCPFTFYIAEAATRIANEMVTFEEGNVDKSNYIDIREEENL